MGSILKTYRSSIILILSIFLGAVIGVVAGPKSSVLEPFGTLFVNLLFMIMVPLVFFSVSSAIANMKGMKRLGKIIGAAFLVFIATSLIAAVISVIGAVIVNPAKGVDPAIIQKVVSGTNDAAAQTQQPKLLQQLVETVTVSDFTNLLSRKNMLQLIVFSVLFGISTAAAGEKGRPIAKLLESGAAVVMKFVSIVMYYAPIGLGCYFATLVGQLGTQIIEGYLRVFLLYLGISVVYYFGAFTFYAFVADRKQGVKTFWKNAVIPSISALATCSSAACIPINLEYVKKMGVTDDIAETVVPLGANIHKDGSVVGGVMKAVFILGLFGKDITSFSAIVGIIAVSFLVGAVMGAIPGGGMIAETLVLTIYGFSPELLPILVVISTIIDAPATLLNSAGNTVSAMLIARFVEGKNWLKAKSDNKNISAQA